MILSVGRERERSKVEFEILVLVVVSKRILFFKWGYGEEKMYFGER